MPALTSRDGAGACATTLSHPRQAYFGRTVRSTRRIAGTTSSASWMQAPMRCIWRSQQGQVVLGGSIISSNRGRCLGNAPWLRRAGLPGTRDGAFGFAAGSSLAACGNGCASVPRSPSESAICPSISVTSRSELAPKCKVLIEWSAARSRSFSSANSSVRAASWSGSAGKSSRRNGMPESYRNTRRAARGIRQITRPGLAS